MAEKPVVTRRLGWAVTAIVALAACIASTGISAGHIWARKAPELALRFWPRSSEAEAQRAASLVSDSPDVRAIRRSADRLARKAIAQDPTNVPAVRIRGLVADLDGNPKAAGQWMRHAESLSRRDLPTQLWLIENAVSRGDVVQALQHYDRALRTSRSASDLLFPVLIAASAEPEVANELSKRLSSRPNWWGLFLNRLIGETGNPSTLILFARRLNLSPDDREHPDFFGRILQRLVDADEFTKADALYRSIVPGRQRLLQNGDFEQDRGILPFAWKLTDESDLAARMESRPDGAAGRALLLDARNGRGGEVAAQAVELKPGRYVLQGIVAHTGDDESARPVVRVRCGSSRDVELAAARLPQAAAAAVSFALPFSMPTRCTGAWVVIEANTGLGGDGERPWLDDLKLSPVRLQSGAVG